MKAKELIRKQLIELKQNYLCHDKEGDVSISWGDLACADELVTDEEVFEFYSSYSFSEEDFSQE